MSRWIGLLSLGLLLVPSPAHPCSLCGTATRRESLAQEFDRAPIVIFGRLANPRANLTPGSLPDGTGTTELQVEKVLKTNTDRTDKKTIVLPRYLPVLNPKDPPRYLVFLRFDKDRLDATGGRQLHSNVLIDYLQGLQAIPSEKRVDRLLYAAQHFDHADAALADEAFISFAQANDEDVAVTARKLDSKKLRKLLTRPQLEPERASLFAYLLGACGTAEDAQLLKTLAEKNDPLGSALEGILAGYISLRPQEGWKLAFSILRNEKEPFLRRYAVVRTLRFFHNSRPEDHPNEIRHALELMISQGEMADMAINDLRHWKIWDHTKLILAQYEKKSHQSPIVKYSIVRYALVATGSECRSFVAQVRAQDPRLVRDLEDELEFRK